ncbi:hypothetical protein P691DRAFT_661531 [Macrolepiota fuliginosa MF-IS2]|uniref:Uncharacterized protein n=1 Tax=Macrolepiota fuliginosa MF-IS2 TaxID=1400762 RepID=A0A9P5XMC4_9AGAR|nr:hypothetical protein P691DRAFT_661531 [Macrolepiota fuliginosa MF-IS2]
MPVPVPRFSKPPSHPVIKNKHCPPQPADLQSLSSSLPPCPTGPPPSFGTREEWIKSLPAWRRDKPRRIWEDDPRSADHPSEQGFPQGLTAAGNAPVIKGAHAEACLPPLFSQFAPTDCIVDEEDDMDSDSSMDHSHLDNQSQWTASSPLQEIEDIDIASFKQQHGTYSLLTAEHNYSSHERGAFSPAYEDRSPEDPVSSPLEPVTPFGVFVDRAVGGAQVYPPCGNTYPTEIAAQTFAFAEPKDTSHQSFAPFAVDCGDVPKEPAPAAESTNLSINAGYKKLAEPLANWVADYVWKVCTTGLSLPPPFVAHSHSPMHYAASAPPYLAGSVHSLLLSTLLQPSAVFLAIWYIIRLPVQFGPMSLGPEYNKEAAFRATLLGDPLWGADRCGMETSAPFRLVVLGCMLANKWLDDHTFSNKTWNSISNVPVSVLNKLEALALDAFSYDLSVPGHEWSQWLTHVISYHKSLSSPGHPQPISRPGSNPHAIIRKTIEEVMEASTNPALTADLPQPVFVGLEDRRREKLEKELQASEAIEIDLDEDGPLREEYVPRRRSIRNSRINEAPMPSYSNENIWERTSIDTTKHLPPPAKWSPAGDEPILRDRNRVSGHYVAVQPPHVVSYPMAYHQSHDITYNPGWNLAVYLPVKPQSGYVEFPRVPQVSQSAYNYHYVPPVALPHSRSQSLSYNQDSYQLRNHARSYSQSIFEYHCSDIRMTANDHAHTEPESHWSNGYAYSVAPSFGSLQATWLRT